MDIRRDMVNGRPADNPNMAPPSGPVFPLNGNQKIPDLITGEHTITGKYNRSKFRGPPGHISDRVVLGDNP